MRINSINTYILVYLLSYGHWNIVVPVRSDPNATAKTPAENVKKTPVKLDIKQSSGTDEFDYKKENNIATFTAKDNYGFNVVRCKNMDDHTWVDIWKTYDEKEYSKKVVLEGDNKLTIHIGDDTSASTKVFNKVGYCKWKEDTSSIKKGSDTGTKTGVDLSLKATAATDHFDYNKVDKVVTFTAKGNNAFSSVKTKDKLVWSTDNASEYATKVVLDGKGKGTKKVTIHLPNNTTKVFKRDGKGKPWNDVSPQAKESAKTAGTTPAGGASQSGGGGTQ